MSNFFIDCVIRLASTKKNGISIHNNKLLKNLDNKTKLSNIKKIR